MSAITLRSGLLSALPDLFAAQAARTPDAIALIAGETRLSYAALARQANQLAHHLRALGAGAETLVGVAMQRRAELLVGLLGVLSAGAAYVPLDLHYPAERLQFMLEDTRATLVLTNDRAMLPTLPADATIIDLDADWPTIARQPTTRPTLAIDPAQLAYLIYTSGSTGRPKAVAISHRSAVGLLAWAATVFTPEQLHGTLAATSLAFDLSVFELFLPLSCGATVILAENVLQLPQLPAANQVTLINTVPSAINELVQQGHVPASVQTVCLAGEPLTRTLAQRIYARTRAQAVYNLYGPSEDTTYSTWTRVPRDDPRAPTIGAPITGTQVYLLDEAGQPVPPDEPGELYIGGAGLARGYLNRPALTAEKFLPDPWSAQPGARLYRTGDLARYRDDGQLEFLGRIDGQIKLRGFRIELGEIESVLLEHPAVTAAAVIVREDRPGDRRLTAYVAAAGAPSAKHQEPGTANREQANKGTNEQGNQEPDIASSALAQGAPLQPSALRTFLAQRLPDYMIPAAFVELDALPLTPNGKLDRRALPAPKRSRELLPADYVAPHTPLERQLAALWSETLDITPIGVHDNFFALGGHSLHATQVIARLLPSYMALSVRSLFEHPTITALAAWLEQSQPRSAAPVEQPLRPASRDQRLPLSFAQQRLWFLDQLTPANAAYHVASALRLTGPLDHTALEQALNAIIARHESLRTSFPSIDGAPCQQIAATATVRLALVDLRALPAAERETQLLAQARETARQPFDLARCPLLRATLFRSAAAEHVLLLTLHHIITDGWSETVLYRELSAFYTLHTRGDQRTPPPLPIQPADIAIWQRQTLQGDALEQLIDYWRMQLTGAPAALDLPTDRPRPLSQTFDGSTQRFTIPAELTAALAALSQREGVTLFMTLLAVFEVVLARSTGQADLVVGTPIANRTRPELEPLIGLFINTLALRTNLAGADSFRELLGRVRETALEAYAHQDAPLEMLVERLLPTRDLSRHPLFQVMFAVQNMPAPACALPGLQVTPLTLDVGVAQVDLTMFIYEHGDQLSGAIEYNTALFDAPTITRLAERFTTLLQSIVAAPDAIDRPYTRLPMLSAAERDYLMIDGHPAPTAYASGQCIHQRFEVQAARTPAAIALSYGDIQLRYDQLDARANQLAHYLRGLGVGPDAPVGIAVERSIELIVGVLGILKAGGAYVPLDPSYPPERQQFICDDTQITVLLTQSHLHTAMSPQPQRTTILLDADWPTIAQQPTTSLSSNVTPDNLAYIIYTSGSTGQPKGVATVHRGVVRLVDRTDYARFGPDETFLLLAPLAFDASTFEIWGALLHGARLAIFPAQPPDLEELGRVVREQQISTLWLTAALFHQMVDSQLDDLRGVRQLLAGGDALSASHVRQTLAALPDCQLINGYGPTENTTFTCCHRFSAGEQIGATVPIGRPIAHTSVYVLDDNLELAPIGAVGELYTGGDGLARGYWQRPALTAEKFLPDPWSDQPGARLYRTGDLVRRRADGVIEFVGRRDNQIKLRGFRIELGEIESVLQQHPAVREAAVLAREDAQGVRRLVAYVVGAPRTENQEPRENREPGTGNKGTNEQGNNEPEPSALAQGAPLQPSALRQFLAQRLPEYMIPAAFVTLVALPISANGKIDRRALSARDLAADDPAQDAPPSTPPRTDLEHALAQIWSQVLGRERIGVHDNFFELGGHSLLATQIAARIGKSFQRAFQVRQIFEAPTVAQLAERLIAGESQPGQTERIAQMLRRLASLPPEERQKLRGRLRTKEGTA